MFLNVRKTLNLQVKEENLIKMKIKTNKIKFIFYTSLFFY